MKKRTNRIIIGVLAVITLFMMTAVAVPYFFKDQLTLTNVQADTPSNWKELDIKKFDKIAVAGSWSVRISQGTEYSVKVQAPAELVAKSCSVENGELIINKYTGDITPTPRIEIIMPTLESIHVFGASEIRVSNFNGEKHPFALTVEGATSFRADNSTFANVDVECQGASSIVFRSCLITAAVVNVSGASNVEIERMDGGELSGSLNGVASLRYSGKVSGNKIKTTGLAAVKQN
ncbi:MAG: DUF2807 domain-containing protein [Bacillota bacterium]